MRARLYLPARFCCVHRMLHTKLGWHQWSLLLPLQGMRTRLRSGKTVIRTRCRISWTQGAPNIRTSSGAGLQCRSASSLPTDLHCSSKLHSMPFSRTDSSSSPLAGIPQGICHAHHQRVVPGGGQPHLRALRCRRFRAAARQPDAHEVAPGMCFSVVVYTDTAMESLEASSPF